MSVILTCLLLWALVSIALTWSLCVAAAQGDRPAPAPQAPRLVPDATFELQRLVPRAQ